jgi:hypothetical protein
MSVRRDGSSLPARLRSASAPVAGTYDSQAYLLSRLPVSRLPVSRLPVSRLPVSRLLVGVGVGCVVPGGKSTMTIELCEATCKSAGYALAGVEYSGECCKLCILYTLPSINRQQLILATNTSILRV